MSGKQITLGASMVMRGFSAQEVQPLLEVFTLPNPAWTTWDEQLQERPWLRRTLPEPPTEICLWAKEVHHTYVFPMGACKHLGRLTAEALDGTQIVNQLVDVPASFTIDPKFQPWPHQTKILTLQTHNSGLFSSPTGSGKTMSMALLAHALQQQTLVVVPNLALLDQTRESFWNFLGVKCGQWASGKVDIQPITLATYQTLSTRDVSEHRNTFGLLLLDEIHKAPGDSWRQVLQSFAAKHRYGCSATIERSDNMHSVLQLMLGGVGVHIKRGDLLQQNIIVQPDIVAVRTGVKHREYAKYDFLRLQKELATNQGRNDMIVKDVLTHSHGRYGAVITRLVDHAERLHVRLLAEGVNAVLYHGQLGAKAQREALAKIKADTSTIAVATAQSIATGFNLPLWDAVWNTLPFSSETEANQLCGRLTRVARGKLKPFLRDFVDDSSRCASSFRRRQAAYTNQA